MPKAISLLQISHFAMDTAPPLLRVLINSKGYDNTNHKNLQVFFEKNYIFIVKVLRLC